MGIGIPCNPSYILYDPKTHKRNFLPSPKSGEQRGALFNFLVLKDGRIFICRDRLGEAIYDPKQDRWFFLEDPNLAIGQTATLLPDGKILLVGGTRPHVSTLWEDFRRIAGLEKPIKIYGVRSSNLHAVTTTRIYDPEKNSWQFGPPLQIARAFHTTVLLPDGRVLVVGGCTTPNTFTTTATCEIISLKDLQ